MKRIFLTILTATALLTLAACGTESGSDGAGTDKSSALPPAQQQENGVAPAISDAAEDTAPEQTASENAIMLTVNGQVFSATLLDNEAAHQLAGQLPLTLNMSELNGNEKYDFRIKNSEIIHLI